MHHHIWGLMVVFLSRSWRNWCNAINRNSTRNDINFFSPKLYLVAFNACTSYLKQLLGALALCFFACLNLMLDWVWDPPCLRWYRGTPRFPRHIFRHMVQDHCDDGRLLTHHGACCWKSRIGQVSCCQWTRSTHAPGLYQQVKLSFPVRFHYHLLTP